MAEAQKDMFSPELLDEIRDRFLYVDWDPFSGQRVYLEASGGSLRLKTVVDTITKESALPDELFRYNPASDYVNATVEKGMEDVKLFLGAKSGHIMPAHSATHAIFRALNAITSHIPGSNIVTTELEHPAVRSSTQYFAETTGKECRVAKLSGEISSVPVESILELVDKDTCVLAFQHGSNQTGSINDVKTIITEARKIKPELYVLVDAVQYAPHGPIDVEEYGADAYAFGPYKAYCVKGIGFAHMSDRLANLPHWRLLDKPQTNWVLGSPAHMMYACWSATVDYLCWLGSQFTESTDRRAQMIAAKDAIHAHMKALLHRAMFGTEEIEGLFKLNHVDVGGMPEDIGNRLCIFLFQLAGMDASTAIGRYNQEHGVRLAARIMDAYSAVPLKALGWESAVRLSGAHYNTPEEIDIFLKATKALVT
ncbi:MAG TPA: aminotransferase class V-fold PLP-dependent enzyme [Candidatus Heimdallarchaeota archaeon]|nr:aminotransferase class V-fold PLP-dependent enzyme [Candidatus Heimdallarchaeota archaeon]